MGLGTKLVIIGAASIAGGISHYGFAPDVWEWYRHDMSWVGNIATAVAVMCLIWGLRRAD